LAADISNGFTYVEYYVVEEWTINQLLQIFLSSFRMELTQPKYMLVLIGGDAARSRPEEEFGLNAMKFEILGCK